MINLELERSIISCLLNDNILINKTNTEITADDFHSRNYSNLFTEIVEVYKKYGYVDATNIKSIMLEEYCDIYNFAITTTRLSFYIKELKELATKRNVAKKIKNCGAELNCKTVCEIKSDMLKIATDINTDTTQTEKVRILDIICEATEYLEMKSKNATKHFKKWGLKWLDDKTGGVKPALIYLAARPAVGKTAFALQLALNLAKQGAGVGIFSLEMDRIALFNRLVCNHANIDKNYFDKAVEIPEEVWAKIGMASAELSNLNINIYDKAFDIEEILLLAQEQKATTGLDVLILDYMQLCESKQKFFSTNDRITYISRQLKKFQQQTGITIIALSQLNRLSEQQQFPTLSSLRDSGSLEQDANMVIFLHENIKMEEQQQLSKDIGIIIAKQREGESGIFTNLKFYGKTQRFY